MSFRRGCSPQIKRWTLGRGGISRLSALTGLSRTTITKAVEELESGGKLVSAGEDRVRRVGGGRKKIEGVDPGVRDLSTKILEETTAGYPMSQLRWTTHLGRCPDRVACYQSGPASALATPEFCRRGQRLPDHRLAITIFPASLNRLIRQACDSPHQQKCG